MARERKLISSREILSATHISRATLNNYIRMGILPKPIVQAPLDSIKGPRKIGYFPIESLHIIEQVRNLKKDGFFMKDIIEKIGKPDIEDSVSSQSDSDKAMKTTAKNKGELSLFPEMDQSISFKSPKKAMNKTMSSHSVALPALLPICVLHASIENLNHISDKILPEAYCAFIEDLTDRFEYICVKNRGLSQCGVPFSAIFLGDGSTASLIYAINAGIEVRDLPENFSVGSSKRWSLSTDFKINVGLGFAEEYCAAIKGSSDRVIMSAGIASAEARHLSLFARGGKLWASKNLLCRLGKEDRKSYRFGVRRGDDFKEHTFLRVGDPSSALSTDDLFSLTAINAAEII